MKVEDIQVYCLFGSSRTFFMMCGPSKAQSQSPFLRKLLRFTASSPRRPVSEFLGEEHRTLIVSMNIRGNPAQRPGLEPSL